MSESDLPVGHADDTDDTVEPRLHAEEPAAGELDELNDAFDTVDAALKALDADDFDQAESLAASLGGTTAVVTDDAVPEPTEA